MVNQYLRVRISKITKYFWDIIYNEKGDNLSQSEFELAAKLFMLRKRHFERNLYNHMNDELNDIQE